MFDPTPSIETEIRPVSMAVGLSGRDEADWLRTAASLADGASVPGVIWAETVGAAKRRKAQRAADAKRQSVESLI